MLYVIYAYIESLIKKIDRSANNPENSSTTKIGEHMLCRYSISSKWAFDNIGNKHNLYHGEYCIKNFVLL